MIELTVNGMTCGGCVRSVTRAVNSVDPSASVEVDLPTKRVKVDSQADAARIQQAIAQAGYEIVHQPA